MKIGILGGTFDPPHVGHLNISLEAIKRFQLNKVIWLITKKNPLKKKSASNDISNRIKLCNELIKKNKNIIKVEYTEAKAVRIKTILKSLSKLSFILLNPKVNNVFFFAIGDSIYAFNIKFAVTILYDIGVFCIGFPIALDFLLNTNFRFRRDSLKKLDDVGNRDFFRSHAKRLADFFAPVKDFF
jgi:cytidyltransferase-like protein